MWFTYQVLSLTTIYRLVYLLIYNNIIYFQRYLI